MGFCWNVFLFYKRVFMEAKDKFLFYSAPKWLSVLVTETLFTFSSIFAALILQSHLFPETHTHTHTDAWTYVTCSEKAEFEPQRPGPISQDIHTLCIDVAKETSQRHHWSSEEKEKGVFRACYHRASQTWGSGFYINRLNILKIWNHNPEGFLGAL